jgi:hypothetical protein
VKITRLYDNGEVRDPEETLHRVLQEIAGGDIKPVSITIIMETIDPDDGIPTWTRYVGGHMTDFKVLGMFEWAKMDIMAEVLIRRGQGER